MKVLVAGGTGRLGTLIVRDLAARSVDVRVLTRDAHRADHLRADGVEVSVGDVRRPETLAPAMAGVDVVVSAVQGFAGPGGGSPKTVDRDGNAHLVAAAKDAGAAVVMLSIVDASPDHPLELARYKYAAEQDLRESGVPWTIVRATAFIELWAELVGKGIVFGSGDNPINFVSVKDVAALVTDAVVDQSQRGRILEIGGPSDLTFNQLVAVLREHTGQPARVRRIPRHVLRVMGLLHRQPRAAYVMDTADLTYRAGPDGRVGSTDVAMSLAATDRPSDREGATGARGAQQQEE